MTGKRYIKIMDGVEINHDGNISRVNGPRDLWEALGWDIDNNPDESAAATEVSRWLIATGFVDLSCAMPKGHTLTLRAIPVKD